MNTTQVSGIAERLVLVALTWAASRGWITTAQIAEYSPLILGVLAAVYGWYINRNAALVQKAAQLPGTTVVTTPELANAAPSEDVVSSTDVKMTKR